MTLALPICTLGLLAVEAAPAGVLGTLVLAGARLGGTAVVSRALDLRLDVRHLCLVPVRDTLSLAIWAASFLGRTVQWAGQRFRVDRQGKLMRVDQSSESLTLAPEEIA